MRISDWSSDVCSSDLLIGLGRPVLFRQARSGLGGRPFAMIKFRSMRDLRDGKGALLPDAQRITAVGRFLRRSRLDELPDLTNIASGELVFLGPRPLLPPRLPPRGRAGRGRGTVDAE